MGTVRAKRLLNAFGVDLVETLSDPESLERVAAAVEPKRPRTGKLVAAILLAAMAERHEAEDGAVAEYNFRQRLEQNGVTNRNAVRRLWRLIGSADAEARLLARPYLAAVVIPWPEADHLGQRLLLHRGDVVAPHSHPERLAGACDAAWRKLAEDGHTAALEEDYAGLLARLLDDGQHRPDGRAAIDVGTGSNAVVRTGTLLRAPGAAWLEDDLARLLARLASGTANQGSPQALEREVTEAEARTGLNLTTEQRGAVLRLLGQPLAVLQGGGGTGKTTVMRIVVEVWERTGGSTAMACISGKAASLLTRAASTQTRTRRAMTVARMLSELARRERMESEGRAPPTDLARLDGSTLLIIDEASMVDTPSLHQLVRLLPDGARLLLVGDPGQLPPVGIGRVFHDLVDDGRYVSSLTRILRQADESPIPHHAAFVRQGRVPEPKTYSGPAPGVFHLDVDAEGMQAALGSVWHDLRAHTAPSDLLVCAALRATVRAFNEERVAEHDPSREMIRLSAMATVAVGDPVVCTRNHYAHALMNGHVGTVAEIGDDGVLIRWDGEPEARQLTDDVFADVELAYALTCHRAQGSAADRVVVALEGGRLMTREWLYTALTRAREQVVLVGPKKVIATAVEQQMSRVTGFRLP